MKKLLQSLAALFCFLVPAGAAVALETGTPAWSIKPMVLHEGPGREYRPVGELDGKIRIHVERCSKLWCQVRAGHERGWTYKSAISFGTRPESPFTVRIQGHYPAGGPGEVCFYEGRNFTGASICGGPGFKVRDLLLHGLDNRMSSVSIEGNVSVLACRDRDFHSYCVRLTRSHSVLEGFLDNGLSSLRVD